MPTFRWRPVLALAVIVIALVGVVLFFTSAETEPHSEEEEPSAEVKAALRQELYSLVQPVRLSNCTLERFGEPNDGGYLVCANLLKPIGSAYSYGISGYDGWGCDISRTLKVPVHEYDCFDTREPACAGGYLRFHAACVGPEATRQDGRVFDTIANQIDANGDRGKRLVVKMDVEGAEWDSFLEAPDSTFEQMDQLVVEFHGVDERRFVEVITRLRRFFHVAHLHYNNYSCVPDAPPFPAWVYEILLVNKKIGIVDDSAPPLRPHPFDAPNALHLPDCQGVEPVTPASATDTTTATPPAP